MDGKSEDVKQGKINNLKEIMPEIFTEGKVDVEKLKLTLGEDLNLQDERYVLNWAGKQEAFKVLQAQSTATLAPAPEESIDFEKTQNVFIEGENLEVLKVLQKSYYGKIKMIYIDPPYNTGNDSFIYPDKFSESKDEYLKRIGDKDEEGFLLKEGLFRKNSKESGHYHSNWLSMMYPRLFLARNLLRDDGVIFVSIDDNEAHNLRMILNEVFGEENYISDFSVVRSEGGGLAKQVVRGHDYLFAFAKNINALEPLKKPKDIRGKIVEKDGIKYWIEEDWLRREFGKYGTCGYKEIEKYHGKEKKKEIDEGIKKGLYVLLEKVKGFKIVGRLRNIEEDGSKFYSILKHLNAKGVHDLEELDFNKYFDYPKPVSLVKELILGASIFSKNQEDIVLDFFAGSGTSAQAVYDLNKEDSGNRKYICVQLPEKTNEDGEAYRAGYKTIADICKERIRRVIKKIKDEKKKNSDLFADQKKDLDLGFKVFKLKTSNFKIWRNDIAENEKELGKQLEAFENPIKKEAKNENILWEILLKSGYDLNTKVEEMKISNCPVFVVADGEMIICLSKINESLVKEIVKHLPKKCICLDVLFAKNDQLKTNTVLQMKDAGVEFKTI